MSSLSLKYEMRLIEEPIHITSDLQKSNMTGVRKIKPFRCPGHYCWLRRNEYPSSRYITHEYIAILNEDLVGRADQNTGYLMDTMPVVFTDGFPIFFCTKRAEMQICWQGDGMSGNPYSHMKPLAVLPTHIFSQMMKSLW